MALAWSVRSTGNPRFPVRIAVERDGEPFFAVRAQLAWPGARGNVFCVRDASPREDWIDFAEIERVPVLAMDRFGRRLSLVLDRAVRKRCEFLVLEKAYKGREGSYEQIFLRTQAAAEAHKSRAKVSLGTRAVSMTIAVDSAERYPWRFPKAAVERRKLPAGDYALVDGERILGVVERKTFDNMLVDFARIGPLHQTLRELEAFPFSAFVIEADYGDFMDATKLKGRWPPAHGYRVMSELQAMHPRLPVIFAGTRKEANLWTYGFFRAIAKRLAREAEDEDAPIAAESGTEYGAESRLEESVAAALDASPDGIGVAELGEAFQDADRDRLLAVLNALRRIGRARCEGRGRAARWVSAGKAGAVPPSRRKPEDEGEPSGESAR